MSLRISTSMMHRQLLMSRQLAEARIVHLGNQTASGERMVSAKDDPVSAGLALGLDRSIAALEQFGKNANAVQSRLGMQENTLREIGSLMMDVNDLTIQANSGALADEDRQAIATQLKQLNATLLQFANADDGKGRYLFAGAADDTAPFTKTATGQVLYNGDQIQRQVEIAPDTFVKGTQPGIDLFMRIRTGDGSVDARADAGNTGTGVVMGFGRSGNAGDWNGSSYTVQVGAGQSYEVLDSSGSSLVPAVTGILTGDEITFEGLRIKIEGEPANGDSFSIGPAGVRDVFATIDNLIGALERPIVGPFDQAVLQNAVQNSLRDVARASEHFITARTAGGAQLAQMDNADLMRSANDVTHKTNRSAIRDLDMAWAIDELARERVALEIAQTVFLRMQNMSLLDRIR